MRPTSKTVFIRMPSGHPSLTTRTKEFLSLSPTRTRTIRSNFLWNAVGNGVFSLSQWGVLVVFAKLGSAALVGQVVYGLAVTAPIFVIAGLQLRIVQATDASNKHTLDQYLGLRVVSTLAALIVAALASIAVWAAGSQSALMILIWALSKTVDSGSEGLYGFFQKSERMDYVGLSLALRGTLALASVALLFFASHSAPVALAGLVIGWSAAFLLYDIPTARALLRHKENSGNSSGTLGQTLFPLLDWSKLKQLCLEAAPLGVVAFMLTIQVQAPRYVVEGLLHARELGLFSAANYLTFIGGVLVNALGAPACVRLAQYHFAGARSQFRKLLTRLLLVAVACGAAGILVSLLAGSRILALLYTNEYSQMSGVLTLLCVASAVSYVASFFGYAMTSLQRFRIQVPIFAAVVLATFLSCYLLTLHYGTMGTAAGMLVGNLIQLFMSIAVVRYTTRSDRRQSPGGTPKDMKTAEAMS